MWGLILWNALVWPVWQLLVSRWALGRPLNTFVPTRGLYRPRVWESHFYTRVFGIKKWKSWLPDGAAWLGHSFSKKKIASRQPVYLDNFARETCRAEWAHWVTMLGFTFLCFGNPPWAVAVHAVYAVAVNVPCILAQRYNRAALLRIGERSARRE